MTSLQIFEWFYTRKHFAKCDSLAVEELAQCNVTDPGTRIGKRLQWCDTAFEALMRPIEMEHAARRYLGVTNYHQQREPLVWPS